MNRPALSHTASKVQLLTPGAELLGPPACPVVSEDGPTGVVLSVFCLAHATLFKNI